MTGSAVVGTPAVMAGRARRLAARAVYYAVMVALALMFLLPLIWMVSTSLKTPAETLSIPPTFIPADPQWQNYVEVFEIVPIFLYNSVKLAVLNVCGLLFFASLAGYAFGRMSFRGRDAAFLVLLATMILPAIVYLLPQYILFLNLGWIDTHYPLWVPRILTPVVGTFLLRQAFKTLPQELEDAAKVDGASTFRIYWQIMLPQVKPALAAVGILTFLESWNDLFGPLIFLNSRDLQTLPVALALFQGEFGTRLDLLMAGATISVVPVLVLFFTAQRFFIQGISMEGMKG